MRMPEHLLWAVWNSSASHPGLCGLQILCEKTQRERLAKEFRNILKAEYYNERSATEFAYCENLLESITETDYGLCVKLGPLAMFVTEEQCISPCSCCVDDSVEELVRRYPSILVRGYIGYAWKDYANGGVIQYEIGQAPDVTSAESLYLYDFMKDKLAEARKEERFTEYLQENDSQISAQEKAEIESVLNAL